MHNLISDSSIDSSKHVIEWFPKKMDIFRLSSVAQDRCNFPGDIIREYRKKHIVHSKRYLIRCGASDTLPGSTIEKRFYDRSLHLLFRCIIIAHVFFFVHTYMKGWSSGFITSTIIWSSRYDGNYEKVDYFALQHAATVHFTIFVSKISPHRTLIIILMFDENIYGNMFVSRIYYFMSHIAQEYQKSSTVLEYTEFP